MFGITAERVFLLLCESRHGALTDRKKKKQSGDILERFAMKPKLDRVRTRSRHCRDSRCLASLRLPA
jgi:hypothetical protein